MSLTDYKKKRNLKKSGEPKATLPEHSKDNLFVVQKHDASHLHWDLRLEMNKTLKSWAVPKEPPIKKGIKRLAIHVEDHPLPYADFEGEIKEGYGKGTVEIWDRGEYNLLEKDEKKIEFELFGKKMKGKYVLIKTKYGNKPEKSWLLFKI